MEPKTSLVILNRNDLEGAKQVVPLVDRSLFCEVFVVDGASTDGSQEYFKSQKIPVHVVTGGGRGGAVRYAIDASKGDYIIYLSSDGEEDPRDLPKFIDLFKQGADMVIASRLAPGAYHKAQKKRTWLHRLLYLKCITFLINVLFHAKLTDCWNGYRGFRREALRAVKPDAADFLIEAQQTIRFLKHGFSISEFATHEGERLGGASGNPIFQSGFLHLVLIFRERWLLP